MRNPISAIIKHKLPSYLATDHERLFDFINHYYDFLEDIGNPLDVLESFAHNLEANNDVDIYVDKILADLGYDIALETTIPKIELVRHLSDFLLSRGSANSFKFLFKVLYGDNPEIEYPRERLLIPSQATYIGNHYVYATASNYGTDDFNALLDEVEQFSVTITGIVSGEVSSVESMAVEVHNNIFYLKIQTDSGLKNFRNEEAITIESEITNISIVEELVRLVTFDIDDPGYGYSIGDPVNVTNTNIVGSAKVKTLRDGGIESLTIVDGGSGYVVNDPIKAMPVGDGHSFSAVVEIVDNSTNYLTTPDHADLDLHATDFTVECWIYRTQQSIEEVLIGNIPDYPNDTKGWEWKISASNKLVFNIPGQTEIESTVLVPLRRWTHIATVREGNEIRHYVNGKVSGLDAIYNGTNSNNIVRIGIGRSSVGILIGYLDELRITKGVARYSNKDFTIPTGSLSETEDDFASVSLLLHFDGIEGSTTFVDSSTTTKTITTNGSIWITSQQTRFGTTSGFFSGRGEITKVRIYSSGYKFNAIPALVVESSGGTGANITAGSTSIGQIETIEYTEPFVDTTGTPVVSVDGSGTGATFTVSTDQIIYDDQPFHKTFEGMLGVNSTVIDSHYWQQFSYIVRSSLARAEYDNIVDEWLHPAGFVRFAIYDNFFSGIFNNTSTGGFTDYFLLTIIKSIRGYDPSFMVNPLYNLEWFKDLSSFSSENSNFDIYEEEWLDGADYYMSPALDADIIKRYEYPLPDYLVNPFDNLDWNKNFVSFEYPNSRYEDFTLEDVSDKSILFQDTLSIEIKIYYYHGYTGETLEDFEMSTIDALESPNLTGQVLSIDALS
jgi:hypothetical protein